MTSQFAKDILSTAVEGGSNYWALFTGIGTDDDGEVTSLSFEDMEDGGVEYHVTAEDIETAFFKVTAFDTLYKIPEHERRKPYLESHFSWHHSYRAELLQQYLAAGMAFDDPDGHPAIDYDAETADNLLQVAAMGTCVYG